MYNPFMGKLNLLKAGYSGKVAGTYGVEKGRQFLIKATPFSHTPHNNLQRQSKDAFTRLNRIASAIARKFWTHLSLSDREMYRNNAVARWLKASLVNHTFYPENLAQVIPLSDELSIYSLDYNTETGELQIIIQNNMRPESNGDEWIFCGVADKNCNVVASGVAQGAAVVVKGNVSNVTYGLAQIFAFKTIPDRKKRKAVALLVTDRVDSYYENEIFIANKFPFVQLPFFDGENVVFPANATFDDDYLNIQ